MATTDAIDLLMKDHERMRDLLGQLVDTTERRARKRKELLQAIARELEIHGRIEEEIFYPAFCEAGAEEEERACSEAKEEHRTMENLVIPDLEGTAPDAAEFGGRAKVLKELVEHHADEEEEETFPRAQEILSQDTLSELGELMAERKQDLEAELA